MSPRLPTLALAVLLLANSADAQERRRVEIGGLGRYTFFDDSWLYENAFGGGGRLGVHLIPWLLVEADATLTSTVGWADDQVRHIPIHVYLVYNRPVGRPFDLRVGAGYVHNEYDQRLSGADNGLAGLLAVQVWLFDLIALRVDGTADFMPAPANRTETNWHFGLQAGLSFGIGHVAGPPSQKPPVVTGSPAPSSPHGS
ncbi:MAG: outer membrane beta-barrel protein [Gemmatimonadota bacterium]|nr:MAG: outer membrane beta-barrel protein [Gemmatimonadota bacterium]